MNKWANIIIYRLLGIKETFYKERTKSRLYIFDTLGIWKLMLS